MGPGVILYFQLLPPQKFITRPKTFNYSDPSDETDEILFLCIEFSEPCQVEWGNFEISFNFKNGYHKSRTCKKKMFGMDKDDVKSKREMKTPGRLVWDHLS